MRWFYVSVGLLATSFCLVTWIYLRDRNTDWRPPEAQLARADAALMLNNVLRGTVCRYGCAAVVLGHNASHRWLVCITVRHRSRCLEINLDAFTFSQQHGLSGVQARSSRCNL